MADAGSQQILDLLDAESVRLKKSGKRLTKAMGHVPDRNGGVPAPIAFAALDDIRRFYASLSGEVAGVETASTAKADVLAALALLDQGYAALEDSLHEGIDKKGVKLARKSRKRIRRAAKDLEAAREGLT